MPFSAAAFRATAAGRAHQDVDVEQSAVIGNRALRFGARRPKPQAAFVHPHIEKDQLNLPDFVSNADPHQCDGTKGNLITNYPQPSNDGTNQEHATVSASLNDGAQQGSVSKGPQ